MGLAVRHGVPMSKEALGYVSRTLCSVLPAMPTGRANARPMTGSASSGHDAPQSREPDRHIGSCWYQKVAPRLTSMAGPLVGFDNSLAQKMLSDRHFASQSSTAQTSTPRRRTFHA